MSNEYNFINEKKCVMKRIFITIFKEMCQMTLRDGQMGLSIYYLYKPTINPRFSLRGICKQALEGSCFWLLFQILSKLIIKIVSIDEQPYFP